jgi:hypothetical protein
MCTSWSGRHTRCIRGCNRFIPNPLHKLASCCLLFLVIVSCGFGVRTFHAWYIVRILLFLVSLAAAVQHRVVRGCYCMPNEIKTRLGSVWIVLLWFVFATLPPPLLAFWSTQEKLVEYLAIWRRWCDVVMCCWGLPVRQCCSVESKIFASTDWLASHKWCVRTEAFCSRFWPGWLDVCPSFIVRPGDRRDVLLVI